MKIWVSLKYFVNECSYFIFNIPNPNIIICFLNNSTKKITLIFLAKSLYVVFLTTPFFTASLNFLVSTGKDVNLWTSSLSTLLFNLFKLLGTFSIYQHLIHQNLILSYLNQSFLQISIYQQLAAGIWLWKITHFYNNILFYQFNR